MGRGEEEVEGEEEEVGVWKGEGLEDPVQTPLPVPKGGEVEGVEVGEREDCRKRDGKEVRVGGALPVPPLLSVPPPPHTDAEGDPEVEGDPDPQW